MSKFRVTREYRCSYWSSSVRTGPFSLGSPMLHRLAVDNFDGEDTVVSISNPGRRRVNFLLEFFYSIASATSLYPTWRSKVFGYQGHLSPGSAPAAWLHYSTIRMRGHLMTSNIFPYKGPGEEGQQYEYFWQQNGWWRVLSDGDLAVNGYIERYDNSFKLNIIPFDNSFDIGSDVWTDHMAFPPEIPYPDVGEERRRVEASAPEKSLPTITPANIDDNENQVSITYQRNSNVWADKCLVVLRNPARVKLKKLVRFGPHNLVTAAPAFGPQKTQDAKEIDVSSVAGKKMELWQAGAFWADYKKYAITFDDTELLSGGVLVVDWNRDGPRP